MSDHNTHNINVIHCVRQSHELNWERMSWKTMLQLQWSPVIRPSF